MKAHIHLFCQRDGTLIPYKNDAERAGTAVRTDDRSHGLNDHVRRGELRLYVGDKGLCGFGTVCLEHEHFVLIEPFCLFSHATEAS